MADSPRPAEGAAARHPDHGRIRSFSGRRGHFTDGQRAAYERLLPALGIAWTGAPLDLAAAFGRAAPTVLEIGFGMGETTVAIAKAHPELNFLGVEVYPAGVGSLLRRAEEAGVSNVRVIQHDAVEVLREMIPSAALEGVHVFFPDPWPKARHHKRRLIQPALVRLLADRLRRGGYLHCATDWAHYAVQMLDVLSREPLLRNTAGPVAIGEDPAHCRGFAPRPAHRPLTKFEKRGLGLGHGVWDVLFERA